MIRNVSDATALLDRRFGGGIGRPMSIVRTFVWVLVGIFLLGLLFPAPKPKLSHTYYNKSALRNTPVLDLILDKNDPRGWKHLKKDPSKFTIAWIGGSTIQTVRPRHHSFIPVDVARRLPRIDGKPVQVNMYLMESSRTYDLYAATADAVATKPDMVILDLNPIWLFNPNAIQSWSNLNPAVLKTLASDPGAWPLLAALDSPTDVALSAASSHLAAIRDRWSYAKKLRAELDKLSPLTPPPMVDPSAATRRLHGTELIATMQEPLNFWNYYRLIPDGTPGQKRYQTILRQAKTDGSVINDDIVALTLRTLADSKIPSIAYMSALDPSTLTDPDVDATLHRIETHLHSIAAQHRSRTLLVRSQSATRYLHNLRFRDMAHITDGDPLVDYLASAVCSQLAASDPKTACTPTPTTRRATR